MINLNLNLLTFLDALLTEKNITRAAQVKGVSISSMNRAIESLRHSLGDQLLVKSGRDMILTPYSASIASEVKKLVHQIEHTFSTPKEVNLEYLKREFSIRATAGFADNYGASLITSLRKEAPNVTLHLINKEKKKAGLLCQETIDAEIAVLSNSVEPNMMCKLLLRDKWVGVAHINHPISQLAITLEDLKSFEFVGVNYRSVLDEKNNDACLLDFSELIKPPIIQVTGFSTAISILEQYPVISIIPDCFALTTNRPIYKFELPLDLPPLGLYLVWHPKYENDAIHRWFRTKIYELFH
ncbi:LysR family transcriptional regulator [Proteus hauseri]|uniref:LysR family transcriptional regulator n=1 Tax=Proteus hauseri TaxID=183417 RepID=UPI0032DAF2FF